MRQETINTAWEGNTGPQPVDRLELVSALSIIGLAVSLVLASIWLVLE